MKSQPACHQSNPAGLRRQHGFSLVELIVALLVGLILMVGLTSLFMANKQNYRMQNTLGRLQENGRYGIDLIKRDLRRAGYWGGNADLSVVTGSQGRADVKANCNTGDNTWGRMVEERIFGLNDSNTGYTCIPDSSLVRGDVLVVRYAASEQAGTLVANRPYMRSTLFEGRIFNGSQSASNLVDDTSQSTRELVSHAFYIGPSDVQCPAGTAVPALFWQTLGDNGRPAAAQQVIGAEHLEVQYGVDTDDNGSIEQYLDADDVADWEQVVAVRVWLLVRAECPDADHTHTATYNLGDQTYTPDDNYRRQLYTTTVMLRN